MPALILKQTEKQEENSYLQARLQKETAEFQNPYKAKVIRFMVIDGIEKIADIDYPSRIRFEEWLKTETTPSAYRQYMNAFDKIKQYSISKEMRIMQKGQTVRPKYGNAILFLPYHPNPDIRAMFKKAPDKHRLAWDFTRKAPEQMKRQVFDILHYTFENAHSYETRRIHLLGLRELYDFCVAEGVEDIEQMEQP